MGSRGGRPSSGVPPSARRRVRDRARRRRVCDTDIREAVLSYNRDDCLSALELREWLETLRAQEEQKRGVPIPRPAPPTLTPKEKLEGRLARIRAVSEALTAHLPVERSREQEAQWVLARFSMAPARGQSRLVGILSPQCDGQLNRFNGIDLLRPNLTQDKARLDFFD